MTFYRTLHDFIESHQLDVPVIDFLYSLNYETPLGRYELNAGNYVNVIEFITKSDPQERLEFENHHRYIDVHICLQGQEMIALSALRQCQIKDHYNAKEDYEGLIGKITEEVELHPYEVLVIEPNLPHAPGRTKKAPSYVKKAILKLVNDL